LSTNHERPLAMLILLPLELAALTATDTQHAATVQQIGVEETRKWRGRMCHGSRPYLIYVAFLLLH
jgi:hypothetical protein